MGEDGRGLLRGRVKALPGPLQQYEDAAVGDGDDQKQEGEDHADLWRIGVALRAMTVQMTEGMSSAANNAVTNRSAP